MGNIPDSMFTVGEHAWHRSGYRYPLDAPPATTEEALREAGMDWLIELIPLQPTDPNIVVVDDPDSPLAYAAVRSDTRRVLGVVGPDYQPIQNVDAFAVLEPLIRDRVLTLETAGVLRGGEVVWVMAKYADMAVEPVNGDLVTMYLLIANGHGGKMALRAANTPIRAVCENTIHMGLGAAKNLITLRHRGAVTDELRIATLRLAKHHEEATVYAEWFRELANVRLDEPERKQYWKEVVPAKEDGSNLERVSETWNRFEYLHECGTGSDIPGVRGSLWGALNAVIEYADYEMHDPRVRDRAAYLLQGAPARLRGQALAAAGRRVKPPRGILPKRMLQGVAN